MSRKSPTPLFSKTTDGNGGTSFCWGLLSAISHFDIKKWHQKWSLICDNLTELFRIFDLEKTQGIQKLPGNIIRVFSLFNFIKLGDATSKPWSLFETNLKVRIICINWICSPCLRATLLNSLVYKMNSIGPTREPWGTPNHKIPGLEFLSLTVTVKGQAEPA